MGEQGGQHRPAGGNYDRKMLQMIPFHPMRMVLALVALLFLSVHAVADTIVLKNGRRILALSAY
jgi:hypothetical protein